MINFNIPPFTGKETEYMAKAIQNHKISGDGEFTKKCNKWIEDHTGTAKALLTTSCTCLLYTSHGGQCERQDTCLLAVT